MSRPVKWRTVGRIPQVRNFVPAESIQENQEMIVLLTEEMEAVRLKDYLGLEQGECAEKMDVSRSTFQRILMAAREKIADALIHGKAIKVSGGNYRCRECGYIHKLHGSGLNFPSQGYGRMHGKQLGGQGPDAGRGRRHGRHTGGRGYGTQGGKFCRGHELEND